MSCAITLCSLPWTNQQAVVLVCFVHIPHNKMVCYPRYREQDHKNPHSRVGRSNVKSNTSHTVPAFRGRCIENKDELFVSSHYSHGKVPGCWFTLIIYLINIHKRYKNKTCTHLLFYPVGCWNIIGDLCDLLNKNMKALPCLIFSKLIFFLNLNLSKLYKIIVITAPPCDNVISFRDHTLN